MSGIEALNYNNGTFIGAIGESSLASLSKLVSFIGNAEEIIDVNVMEDPTYKGHG